MLAKKSDKMPQRRGNEVFRREKFDSKGGWQIKVENHA
jgi:hypothetical protein